MNEKSLGERFRAGLAGAVQEIGGEMKRLGVQGSMELASALFNGHAFVPYGPGQWKDGEREGLHQEQEQKHGMSM
jgi:hypothetical protein